jgi:hypothetical protein
LAQSIVVFVKPKIQKEFETLLHTMYEGDPILPMCIIGMIQNENWFQVVVVEVLACKQDPNENGKYIGHRITLPIVSLNYCLNHVFVKVSDLSFND